MTIVYNNKCSCLVFLLLVTVVSTKRFRLIGSDVEFTLHTRNDTSGTLLTKNNINIVPQKYTVLLVGGWNHDTTSTSSYFRNFTDVYLKDQDINVIQTHVNRGLIPTIFQYVERMGKSVGDFLVLLESQNRVPLNQQHLIGVQAGSHIAGTAANYANSQGSTKVDRISALSPTTTKFLNFQSIRQLKNTDARLVDVYVTSRSGLQEHIGTTTFYPNGGQHQPLCPMCTTTSDECSEMRSVWLYIYTIGLEVRALICDSYENFITESCGPIRQPWYGDFHNGIVTAKAYIWLYCWAPGQCKQKN